MAIFLPSRPVKLKFALGELVFWEWTPKLAILEPSGPITETQKIPEASILNTHLKNDTDGILARRVDIAQALDEITVDNGLIFYTQPRVDHFFIEINCDFDVYLSSFSSKSRQNIIRSVRKIESSNPSNQTLFEYKTPDEIAYFLNEAIKISRKTYQAQLLKSGLPETNTFRESALKMASHGKAFGYILNIDNKPVAFAWCRKDGIKLIYDIIGYLPEYSKQSPGTALLFLILKSAFAKREFTIFDFGPGRSTYKEMFSNSHIQYNEIYIFNNTIKFKTIIYLHRKIDKLSVKFGNFLNKIGFKNLIKKSLRSLIRKQ